MESFILQEDIAVMCKIVHGFPNGIQEAFTSLEQLHANIPDSQYYGISYMDADGKIVYKAAVSIAYPGEAEKQALEPFTILKGKYLSIAIDNWMSQLPMIGTSFSVLMQEPDFDNTYPCIEWYKNDDEMMCMVRSRNQ